MPHLPSTYGTYPMVLRDYRVNNLQLGEILMDYDKFELYYVKRDTGELISIARVIFDQILKLRTENTFFDIVDADKSDPPQIDIETPYPPINDRKYNHIYYVVKKRQVQSVDDSE